MKEIRILYLYPDILDLYGDIGNIKIQNRTTWDEVHSRHIFNR